MKLKIVYFLCTLLAFFTVSSCKKDDNTASMRNMLFGANSDTAFVKAKEYNFYQNSRRQLIFNEPFDDNKHNWPIFNSTLNNSRQATLMYDGTYFLSGDVHYSEDAIEVDIPLDLDTTDNYDVEYRYMVNDFYSPKTLQGLTLKGIDSFFLLGNWYEQQAMTFLVKKSNLIFNQNSENYTLNGYFNTITLRKTGNKYLLFVNEKYEGYTETSNFPINKIGFYYKAQVSIDYIKVYKNK